MSLFRFSARTFSAVELYLVDRLSEEMCLRYGHSPSPAEQHSWGRSIPVLVADLLDAGLGDVEVILEYALPLTSKRADAIVAGVAPGTREPSYLVVELKQWSRARRFEDSDTLVSIDQYARPVLHPLLQVREYRDYMTGFLTVLEGREDTLATAAYLHNALTDDVRDLLDVPQDDRDRLFTGRDRAQLHDFLRSRFAPVSGAAAADALLASDVAPSTQLLAVAADEIQRRERFTLLDEQRAAYEYVLHQVLRARESDRKTAVIVQGGPGTGKSVIALSVLGELTRRKAREPHATGPQAFTTTHRKVAGARSSQTQALFKYFNQFGQATPNGLDCLIMDEAHRLRATSANRYTPAAMRGDRSQVDELLSASRVPVFLLDENQVVRPGEIGTAEIIRDAAGARGMAVTEFSLEDQFRCGGSRAFVEWVEMLLGLREGDVRRWDAADGFDVVVADAPSELEQWVLKHASDGYSARMTAGFCWRWSDVTGNAELVDDVVIGDWARPWNVKRDRKVGAAPSKNFWATDPAGVGQVGCVYTAQGFEYDYGGVIIGPDLVRRGDAWVVDISASHDPALRRRPSQGDWTFATYVKNVYKVLFTRSMRGTCVFSTDPETQDFLLSVAPALVP